MTVAKRRRDADASSGKSVPSSDQGGSENVRDVEQTLLSRTAFAGRHGIEWPALSRLIDAGALELEDDPSPGRWSYVKVLPDWSLFDIYERWAADLAMPLDHADFEVYRTVRTVCRVPIAHPHPSSVMQGLLRQAQILGTFYHVELNAFVSLRGPSNGRLVEELRSLGAEHGRRRLPLPPGAPPTAAMFADAVPELMNAPRTCFVGRDGEDLDAPTERTLRVLYELKNSFALVALYMFVVASSYRRKETADAKASLLAKFDAVFTKLEPNGSHSDPEAVRRVFDHVVASAECGAEHRPGVRADMCREWMTMVRALTAYVRSADADGRLGLRRLLPAAPSKSADGDRLMQKAFGHLRARAREGRKVRSDRAADKIALLQDAASNRLDQVTKTADAADAVCAAAMSDGRCLFDVELPGLDRLGRLSGEMVTCRWQAWREDELLATLRDGRPANPLASGLVDRRAIEIGSGRAPKVFFEFLGVEGFAAEPACEPWFVSIFRSGVLATPGSLTPGMRQSRQDALLANELPTYLSTPTGLLSAPQADGAVWRKLAERGRVTVSIVEFAHAMRFAHLAFRCVIENMARTHELLQQVYDQDGWERRQIDGDQVYGFLAFPKQRADTHLTDEPTFFPVLPGTLREMEELCLTSEIRQGRPGRGLPSVAGCRRIRWKVPKPAPFVFSFGGRALEGADLQRFLAFLLMGHGKLTLHDIRHAASAVARAEGVGLELVRAALNHADPAMTNYYSRPTDRQRLRELEAALKKRSVGIAGRRSPA